MEVDKSTKGTIQEQMFYNGRTLQDITQMRHDNPTDQVQYTIHISDYLVEKFMILFFLMSTNPFLSLTCEASPHKRRLKSDTISVPEG